MGTTEKGFMGGFRGKLGTAVGASWKGKDVIRSMPPRKRRGGRFSDLSAITDSLKKQGAHVFLQGKTKKAAFKCGKPSLNEYLHKQAKQDAKRKLSACFILAETDGTVKGYYTLSASSV
jgi:hypothetical protein